MSAEGDLDVRAAATVPRGVGQRLLEDPVGGLVDRGCEVPATRRRTRTTTSSPEARWRSASVSRAARPGGGSTPVGRVVLAEHADELVDLAQRLAGDFLDRLERCSCSLGILLLQQACGAGLDEDHVDRVAGRVVEVAGDAGALLGGCEAALALGLPLGARDAFHKLCETRAPLPETVAEDPGAAPDNGSEEERHDGKFVLADAGGANVDDEQADDGGGGQPRPGSRLSRIERKEEEGDGRAERWAKRVSEGVQAGAGRGGERKDGQGRAAPDHERKGRERRQDDAEQIEVSCVVSGAAGGEERERESEHAHGDPDVDKKLLAVHASRVTARPHHESP